MRRMSCVVICLLVGGLLTAGCTTLPDSEIPGNQISAGGMVGGDFSESTGSAFGVEWELPLAEKMTIVPQLRAYRYDWEGDGSDWEGEEDGNGIGIGAEWRFYPMQAMNGFHLGAGFGFYPAAEWDYDEWEASNGKRGKYDKDASESDSSAMTWEVHATFGWTFRISKAFAITPMLNVGNFISNSPEAGLWGGIGVNFSFGF